MCKYNMDVDIVSNHVLYHVCVYTFVLAFSLLIDVSNASVALT